MPFSVTLDKVLNTSEPQPLPPVAHHSPRAAAKCSAFWPQLALLHGTFCQRPNQALRGGKSHECGAWDLSAGGVLSLVIVLPPALVSIPEQ